MQVVRRIFFCQLSLDISFALVHSPYKVNHYAVDRKIAAHNRYVAAQGGILDEILDELGIVFTSIYLRDEIEDVLKEVKK